MTSPTRTTARIGDPLNRVDGVAKVTGQARYAAEHPVEGLLYGWVVSSGITKGRIVRIHDEGARALPEVVEVMTHTNRPQLPPFDHSYTDAVSVPGSPFRALYDEKALFNGQPIAVVIAGTLETARYAASLIDVEYESESHNTDFAVALTSQFVPNDKRSTFEPPQSRGDAHAAYDAAPLKVAADFHVPAYYHNPMEMHASTVVWEGNGRITVYDKTQGPQNVQAYLAAVFGFSPEHVRVKNPYVGGAFGSGLRPQYQVYLATLAAKMLERSVRVVLTRQQMFSHVHRPETVQTVALATDTSGRLQAIINDAATSTSRFEDYMETVCDWGLMNYACENASAKYTIARVDTYTSGDMRAPGAATGMTLFELAVDEMAYAASVDPLQFRLINYSDKNAMDGTPFTSKALREACAQGAEKFGWSRRTPAPRSMRDGRELVGWGVATGIWDALFEKTSAHAKLLPNGDLEVATAASDIGTGTYTVMAQVAADTLGLPIEKVTATLGDSALPKSTVEGGSKLAASAGAAVQHVCRGVAEKLLVAADQLEGQPLGGARMEDVTFAQGRIALKSDATRSISFGDAMSAAGLDTIEVEDSPAWHSGGSSQTRKSRNTHNAIFAEVKVDEELCVVRVTRIVIAVAAGRIINPKTARSQILGGVVMGIGMALHEETATDHRLGRVMNHNFAEYHIPAHADIQDIEVIFVDEPDPEVTPLGVKGVGEIGIVGTAAAVVNAIYHATGKRVHSLPVTIDKLLV
ncbi:MAG: aldehyde oxidase [Gammaproteobacteria bacterium]|nr:aldehyde oxidase [Gammaproteobacteria bacterium]